jgi:hypothetical protein
LWWTYVSWAHGHISVMLTYICRLCRLVSGYAWVCKTDTSKQWQVSFKKQKSVKEKNYRHCMHVGILNFYKPLLRFLLLFLIARSFYVAENYYYRSRYSWLAVQDSQLRSMIW